MPYAKPEFTASASAGPPVKPDVPHVSGVVARRNVSVRRRKHSQAASVQFGGDRTVTDIPWPAIRTGGQLGVKLPLRVVVSHRRDNLAPTRPHTGSRGGKAQPRV